MSDPTACLHPFRQRGVGFGLQIRPADRDGPQGGGPQAHREYRSPRIGEGGGGKEDEEIEEAVEPELHSDRPVRVAPGIGHDAEKSQQREVANDEGNLERRAADPADLELGPADQGEQTQHQHVVDHVPVRVDDRQRYCGDRQRDPAGPHGKQQAFTLAVRQALLPRISGCPAGRRSVRIAGRRDRRDQPLPPLRSRHILPVRIRSCNPARSHRPNWHALPRMSATSGASRFSACTT